MDALQVIMAFLPLCLVSIIGFFVILQFSLKNKDNLLLMVLTCIGNMLGIFLFTQVFPDLYLLSMIASATFCLIAVWLLSKRYDKSQFDAWLTPCLSCYH